MGGNLVSGPTSLTGLSDTTDGAYLVGLALWLETAQYSVASSIDINGKISSSQSKVIQVMSLIIICYFQGGELWGSDSWHGHNKTNYGQVFLCFHLWNLEVSH